MNRPFMIFFPLLLFLFLQKGMSENGYDCWLRYKRVENHSLLSSYRQSITQLQITGNSATIQAARQELLTGLKGMLGDDIPVVTGNKKNGTVIAGSSLTTELKT